MSEYRLPPAPPPGSKPKPAGRVPMARPIADDCPRLDMDEDDGEERPIINLYADIPARPLPIAPVASDGGPPLWGVLFSIFGVLSTFAGGIFIGGVLSLVGVFWCATSWGGRHQAVVVTGIILGVIGMIPLLMLLALRGAVRS